MNFIHFSGYKYMIRLVSILWKRKDHALISISTILKFSAQIRELFALVGIYLWFIWDVCWLSLAKKLFESLLGVLALYFLNFTSFIPRVISSDLLFLSDQHFPDGFSVPLSRDGCARRFYSWTTQFVHENWFRLRIFAERGKKKNF